MLMWARVNAGRIGPRGSRCVCSNRRPRVRQYRVDIANNPYVGCLVIGCMQYAIWVLRVILWHHKWAVCMHCKPYTARAMMLVDRSDEKKWCHRASLRSTSCSGKTTVPSGSTSNSGACANRASSGQLEDARHPCITRGQWGGMPRPWRPTAGSCRRRQARAMKGRRTTLRTCKRATTAAVGSS